MSTQTKSVFVRELTEFGERLAKDGYPTQIIERAAERMRQLEELVVSQDEQFQQIGKNIRLMQNSIDRIANLPMCQRQAE